MSSANPTQPPIVRGSITPRPWAGHPLRRLAQRLLRSRPTAQVRSHDPRPLMWRRVVLLLLVAASAVIGTDYMAEVLPRHGGTWLEQGILALYGVLFAWISAGFWTGVMGAWVLLRGGDAHAITNALKRAHDAPPLDGRARTAIVMPICNEHVPTVFAGLRATFESLRATGRLDQFDFFVLSDTSKPDLRAAEQAAFAALREDIGLPDDAVGGRFFYRWRQHRTKRKAGNVADFCRRWGRDYRYMVVFDADSVMTGECLTSLVRLMEAHPDAGIIQTSPVACGHSSLHARVQQFGARVYGPLFTAGMHFWQLGESHYWGHNAILRIAPFMAHCGLAPLPGTGAMSGEIMSHDFVEAALMRRAGWKVWIAHDLPGSYEQVPPNLIAELQRDRRWCHGNLQNSRLMFEPGLHPVHRSVFLTGLLAYVSAPLWLGFLLLSTRLIAELATELPQYFVTPYQLFPLWPTADLQLMLTLFGMTVVLLVGPKLMSLAVIVMSGRSREFGGVGRLLASALLEFFYNMLLAPVRMLFHTQFVLAAFVGRRGGWTSPPRDDDSTPWSEALRRHGIHTVLAAAWIGGLTAVSSAVPWWLSPIIGGLLLAAPLSVWGSRSSVGSRLQRVGLLLIPEERDEPAVLNRARWHAARALGGPTFVQAVVNAEATRRVVEACVAREPARGRKAVAHSALVVGALYDGPAALSAAQRMRLLGSADALLALAQAVAGRGAHADWWTDVASAEDEVRQADAGVAVPAHRATRPTLGVANAR
jgi:membrane glycosyltransferase